jgi:hypothetical protein
MATKKPETAIALPEDKLSVYAVLNPEQAPDIMELIQTNMGDNGVQIKDLDHITVPTGGGKAFNLSDGVTTTLTGLIILAPQQNGYWPKSMEEDPNSPPVCTANDGKTGQGSPGGCCAVCPLKEWGSDPKGKGKACRDMRPIYLLQEEDFLPIVIQTPRMSIKPLQEYFTTLTRKGIPFYSAVTRVGLKQEQKPGVPAYSVLTFKLLDIVPRERREVIRAYQAALLPHVTAPQATGAESRRPTNPEGIATPMEDEPDDFDPWADEEPGEV